MAHKSKRLRAAEEKIEPNKKYTVEEAVQLLKDVSQVKFDPTVEIHANLNIDIKKSDQQIRAAVKLPHGTGKTKRIAAFVGKDKQKEATDADLVGGQELIDQIKKTGKTDFDVAIATPEMMPKLAVVAKNLGQKGLMPNPKSGTITTDVKQVIQDLRQGMVSLKNDTSGNLHLPAGKLSWEDAKLIENVEYFVEELKHMKPDGVKGSFIKGVYLTSSMAPSIELAV